MWADKLTKPLEGTVSRMMREKLMNTVVDYNDRIKKAETHLSFRKFEKTIT